ncbi:MAG TPA: DNA mismatch repair protein MutS, partial [Thermoanaerobaculia bacterium]
MRLYYERRDARLGDVARLRARERAISLSRLAAIVVAVLAATVSMPVIVAIAVAAFFTLVFVHERVIRARSRAERAAEFYAAGIDRIEGTWVGKASPGNRFRDDHHPYESDLDLFGRGSLFEMISRAATSAGEAKLATWLKSLAHDASEVAARQQAVVELRDAVDFREEMAVVAGRAEAPAGEGAGAPLDEAAITRWANAPARSFAPWERIVSLLLPVVSLVVVFLAARPLLLLGPSLVPPFVVVIVIAAQMMLARHLGERAEAIVGGVERAEPALSQLARILRVAASREFTSPRLIAIRSRIGAEAARELDRLGRLVALLDSRRNQFFAPIALLLLWTSNIAVFIERWRSRNGAAMLEWIDAVGELESLSSLGAFAFENPDYAMPVIATGRAEFVAESLGHPLIPSGRRVANDLRLDESMRLLIVSGSNMSGKSTFMRSTGLAAVLAFAGGPVCAKSLRISPMNIGASIRINDSLQEGASRFYAEIVRIRQILDLGRGETPLLFLLDEILHGTNSHDRRIGAGAVIRRLVESGGIGLVSTHDLALAEIVQSIGSHAANVHFEDHIEDGKMSFDYRLQEGVVRKSNALELMRSVGI